MIESKYVENIALPRFDGEVSCALQYDIDGGGKSMFIGIENGSGEIYRIVMTIGLGSYIQTVNALVDLGFSDILKDALHGDRGFDSRMVPGETLLKPTNVGQESTDAATELLAAVPTFADLPEMERQSLLKSRIGQGLFRHRLIQHWGKCAVTGASCIPLLRASHIKPWRDSTNAEKIDLFNGLLLVPNLDAAFDAGFITFESTGQIVLAHGLLREAAYQLHITPKMRLDRKLISASHVPYLEYHRLHVYRGDE